MRIKPLDPNVIKKLRSDIAFTDVAQCVEELVWNSIDSGANCIAVRLNLPFFKIQVIDNGCGIPADQMVLVGKRYATSKCHTLQDLQNLQYGGFRGEALASLKDISSHLMIESRSTDCNETYCKIFTHGNDSKPTLSINPRPSKGTTVTVFDYMYNRPVRKHAISEAIDLEETRRLVQSIALVHPWMSFSLQNEVTGEMCLQLKKCSSVFYAFAELFGRDKARNLKVVEYEFERYKISGYISTDAFSNKDFQFLYVNKRLVRKTRLHKFINDLLNKAFSRKQLDLVYSPSKNQAHYGAFVLDVVCDRDKCDTVFDRKRTMVEFSEWDKVAKLVEDAVLGFLKSEKLISSPTNLDHPPPANSDICEDNNTRFLNLGVDNFKNGLFSHAAKRLDHRRSQLSLAEDKVSDVCIDSLPNAVESKNSKTVKVVHTEVSKEKITILSNDVDYEKEVISKDKNYICLKNTSKVKSVLDALKGASFVTKTDCVASVSCSVTSVTSSVISKADIPSQSVFPIQSPVMLRIPVESTLSQLQKKKGSSSMMHKLKEKYLFSRQKSDKSTKLIEENKSNNADACNGDGQVNRPEAIGALKDQCESIVKSIKHNEIDNDIQIIQETKSSLVDKNDSRITSKYSFHEDTHSSPLKRLRRSKPKKLHTLNEDVCDLDTFSVEFENHQKKVCSTLLVNTTSVQTPEKRTLVNRNFSDDFQVLQLPKSNKICKNDRPLGNVTQSSISDSSELPLKEECLLSGTDGFKNEMANMQVNEISNFSLNSFSPTKRKFNEDTQSLENEDRSEVLPLLNDSQLDGDENVKNNDNNHKISLLEKIQTSTTLLTPSNFLQTKKLKSSHTITYSNESEKSKDTKTNITIVDNKNKKISLASRLFQDLDEDICLSEFIEDDYFSSCYFRKKPCSNLVVETINDAQNVQKDVVKHAQSEISESHTANHFQNVNFPTNCNVIWKKQSNKLVSDTEQSVSSTTSHSQDLDMHTDSDNGFPFMFKMQMVSEKENVNLSSKEINSIEHENDIGIIFDKEIFPDINSNSQILPNQSFNMVSKDSPQISSASNNVVNIHGDKSPTKSLSMKSSTRLPFYDLGAKSLDSSSSNKTSPRNPITDQATFEVCHSQPKNKPLTLPFDEFQTQDHPIGGTNSDELLKKSDSIDIHMKCSVEPVMNKTCVNQVENNESQLDTTINADGSSKINSPLMEPTVDGSSKSRWIQVNEGTKRTAYIDSVTGNSTYNVPETLHNKETSPPKELAEIQTKKQHFFLTHDFSPFVKSVPIQNEPEENNEIYDLQIDLNGHIDHNENSDWQRKWRYPMDKSSDDSIQDMFQKWENPMFDISHEINSIDDTKVPVCLPHMYFLNSYRFNGSSLDSLKVIGQVDCKFIACVIQDFSDTHNNRKLLALFDQHAVHERIKLEELTDDLYNTKEDRTRTVKSQPISPPLKLSLEPPEMRLLHSYHSTLEDLGISLCLDNDSNTVEARSLPVCLVHKDRNQLRRKASETTVLVEKIIKEWLSTLMQNRGVSSLLPKTLGAVLNSQACRGAVKFGDYLSLSQCEDLMTSLTKCKLPFQCAHGRPSIAPILDLNKIESIAKKRHPPQLWKMSKEIKRRLM